MKQCCGSIRSFEIAILDDMEQTVLKISRKFKCCAGFSWCVGCFDYCAFELKIEAPIGQVIGYVRLT